jgi:hypothetical protein
MNLDRGAINPNRADCAADQQAEQVQQAFGAAAESPASVTKKTEFSNAQDENQERRCQALQDTGFGLD